MCRFSICCRHVSSGVMKRLEMWMKRDREKGIPKGGMPGKGMPDSRAEERKRRRLQCASPFHAEQRELKSLTVIGAGKPATYPLCCLESVCSGWDCGLPKHIPVSACRIIPCVASVAVSPYNLSKNQNRLSGRLFPCVFSATCRKENTHGKRSGNARDKRFWFIFDYRNSLLSIRFLYHFFKIILCLQCMVKLLCYCVILYII